MSDKKKIGWASLRKFKQLHLRQLFDASDLIYLVSFLELRLRDMSVPSLLSKIGKELSNTQLT